MKKTNDHFEISELIVKHHLNICSTEEKERLHSWLQEKPEHKELYEKIVNRKILSGKIDKYLSYQTAKALEDIKPKLSAKRRLPLYKKVLRYAAILLLPIMIGVFVYWYIHQKEAMISEISDISIPPGYSKAILKMSDGTLINLEDTTFQMIKEQDGTLISNNAKILRFKIEERTIELPSPLMEEISIPRGGEFQLVLPDGTKVWLNSETNLEFPSRFAGKQRMVKLKSGEAFFEVAKNNEKPFIVQVNGLDIKVLGTSFNVSAYKDDIHIQVTLTEGKVRLISKLAEKSKELTLSPGEQGTLAYHDTFLMKREVDTRIYTAWTKGEFVFSNTNVDEVLKKLSRWYNVNIVFENDKARLNHFTGTLKRYEDIAELLGLIQYSSKLTFSAKENTIYVN